MKRSELCVVTRIFPGKFGGRRIVVFEGSFRSVMRFGERHKMKRITGQPNDNVSLYTWRQMWKLPTWEPQRIYIGTP